MTKLLTATQQKNLERLLDARYHAALREVGYAVSTRGWDKGHIYSDNRHQSPTVTALYEAAAKEVEDAHAAKFPAIKKFQKKIDDQAKRNKKAFDKIREEAVADGLHVEVYYPRSPAAVQDHGLGQAKRDAQQKVAEKLNAAALRIQEIHRELQEKILVASLVEVENLETFLAFPATEELLA